MLNKNINLNDFHLLIRYLLLAIKYFNSWTASKNITITINLFLYYFTRVKFNRETVKEVENTPSM